MLLLEAVSAAVPTVVMPPAVRATVDSICAGMGMPPFQWASPTVPARALEIENTYESNGVSLSQSQLIPLRGENLDSPPLPQSGAPRHDIDESASYGRVSADGWGETVVSDKGRTGRAGGGGDGNYVGLAREAMVSGPMRLLPRRHYGGGGDDGSYAGSEGSGVLFPPVMPIDDSEEDEEEGARPMEIGFSLSAEKCAAPLQHTYGVDGFTGEEQQETSKPFRLRDKAGVLSVMTSKEDTLLPESRLGGLAQRKVLDSESIRYFSDIPPTQDSVGSQNNQRLTQGQEFAEPTLRMA